MFFASAIVPGEGGPLKKFLNKPIDGEETETGAAAKRDGARYRDRELRLRHGVVRNRARGFTA